MRSTRSHVCTMFSNTLLFTDLLPKSLFYINIQKASSFLLKYTWKPTNIKYNVCLSAGVFTMLEKLLQCLLYVYVITCFDDNNVDIFLHLWASKYFVHFEIARMLIEW